MFTWTLAEQTWVFFQAAVLGLVMGLFYDILRIIRILSRAKTPLTAILDLLYCAGLMASVFLFILSAAGGMARAYMFAGVILGAMLYFASASPLIVRAGVLAGRWTAKMIAALMKPFRLGIKAAQLFLQTLCRKCRLFYISKKKPKNIRKNSLSFLENVLEWRDTKVQDEGKDPECIENESRVWS